MKASHISTKENRDAHKYVCKTEFPDPDKNLLWKLYLRRKEAFEAMNHDVDEIVNQCLTAKKRLEALEDSNRNISQEMRSLRSKYEALLEKNRKDTGIIMHLKDAEPLFKKAVGNRQATSESLGEIQIKNKEKALERKLLQDDREKLVFRSQTFANILRKKNLKHKHLYELIVNENRKYEENEKQFMEESQQLKYLLDKNDGILEQWLKNNAERDASIRCLQDDMKVGLKIPLEDDEENATNETTSDEVELSSDKTNFSKSPEEGANTDQSQKEGVKVDAKSKSSKNNQKEEQKDREKAFHKEWLSKKTLFEAAEKQKELLVDFYMIINKRMQDLNIEIVNVREWLLDKETEKRELLKRASAVEKLVSEKRRQKPVPPRTSTDEMKIWIDVQRETNDALRKIAYKCLSVKQEDAAMHSQFSKTIRNIYLNTLKEQLEMEHEEEEIMPKEKQDEQK